jgi:hypothetical protein
MKKMNTKRSNNNWMETNITGKSRDIIPKMDPTTTQHNQKPKCYRKSNICNHITMATNMDVQK